MPYFTFPDFVNFCVSCIKRLSGLEPLSEDKLNLQKKNAQISSFFFNFAAYLIVSKVLFGDEKSIIASTFLKANSLSLVIVIFLTFLFKKEEFLSSIAAIKITFLKIHTYFIVRFFLDDIDVPRTALGALAVKNRRNKKYLFECLPDDDQILQEML